MSERPWAQSPTQHKGEGHYYYLSNRVQLKREMGVRAVRWLSQGVCGQDWGPEFDPQDTDWKQKARELSSDLHTCSHMYTYCNQKLKSNGSQRLIMQTHPSLLLCKPLPFGVTLFFFLLFASLILSTWSNSSLV